MLQTTHGELRTPAFMPVGTKATVKMLDPHEVRDLGAEIVLCNTYHLSFRPGADLIAELGGLHRFMGWDGPILTDSGGFQVFSLARLRTMTEEGVHFRAPADGSLHHLTPERAIEVQHALGVDILHPLDECLGYPATREDTERSLGLTLRWARRSLVAHRAGGADAALFGIVQGGFHADLRARAAAATVALGFDGYAIGGMAVGEPKLLMRELTEAVARALPAGQPRYLMGVGKPEDLVEAVARGTFSRAYLRHLFMTGELLVYRLLSLHNLYFFLGLMAAMRAAIAAGGFGRFRTRFFERYAAPPEPEVSAAPDASG